MGQSEVHTQLIDWPNSIRIEKRSTQELDDQTPKQKHRKKRRDQSFLKKLTKFIDFNKQEQQQIRQYDTIKSFDDPVRKFIRRNFNDMASQNKQSIKVKKSKSQNNQMQLCVKSSMIGSMLSNN